MNLEIRKLGETLLDLLRRHSMPAVDHQALAAPGGHNSGLHLQQAIDLMSDRTDGLTWAASVLLCLVLCALLFVASEVREQACFWVEACGVSRWLRTAVQLGYYPALLGVALLLGDVTIRFPQGLRLVRDWSSRLHLGASRPRLSGANPSILVREHRSKLKATETCGIEPCGDDQ